MMLDAKIARRKVASLMEAMGISKTKFGNFLGGEKKEDYRVSLVRANRFLKGESPLSVQILNQIAKFFDKPVEYFLYDDTHEILKNSKIVELSDFIQVPFFGSISCGELTEGVPPTDEFRPILKKNLMPGKKYVVLHANGFSMIDAGVQEGDEVLVCLDCEARNGDICVFEFRDEMVMGYYYNDGRYIEIRKANKNYAPIPIDNEDFRIVGVVVSSFRTFRRMI